MRENRGDPLVTFAYDAAGRRSDLTSGGTASRYDYDGIGRLKKLDHDLALASGDQVIELAYNPAGQIVTRSGSNNAFAWNGARAVDRPYSVNGQNQYIAAGSATFGYDSNGNLISDGSTSFTYDVENRLVSASGAKSATLTYDPLGRLWEVSSPATGATRFLYDDDALIAEYNPAGYMHSRYIHGAEKGSDDPLIWYDNASSGWRRALVADQQGSIIAVADMHGNPLALNAYDEYGIAKDGPNGTPGAGNRGRFQYTGQAWLAELGMYYYKARIYSPTLGRFMQTDPIGYDGGINLYTYAEADPLNYVDPSGNIPLAIPVALGVRCALNAACRAVVASGARAIGRYVLPVRIVPQTLPQEESESSSPESPDITPQELKGKSRDEIRKLAGRKGLKPDPKKPDKFRDPVTGKERLRIDPGHIDKQTGKPYDNPNAARDHVHGYKPDGTKIVDPKTKDPHFPLK